MDNYTDIFEALLDKVETSKSNDLADILGLQFDDLVKMTLTHCKRNRMNKLNENDVLFGFRVLQDAAKELERHGFQNVNIRFSLGGGYNHRLPEGSFAIGTRNRIMARLYAETDVEYLRKMPFYNNSNKHGEYDLFYEPPFIASSSEIRKELRKVERWVNRLKKLKVDDKAAGLAMAAGLLGIN